MTLNEIAAYHVEARTLLDLQVQDMYDDYFATQSMPDVEEDDADT